MLAKEDDARHDSIAMSALWLVPVYISTLLIAAHFLRSGAVVLAGTCGALPLLLLIPRRWSARVLQVFLILASLEWCRALYPLVQGRIASGQPWLRLAFIIGAVAVCTAASAFVFKARPLRARYRLEG